MFEMHPDKAPRPDGFNPGFYLKMCHVVGGDVVHAWKSWLNAGLLSRDVQQTNIILLPKVSNSKNMKELLPISLCNVLYKLITKVLANRLRMIMFGIIGEEQSALINGCSISDNVLDAFEMLQAMKIKKRTKQEFATLKIDIYKPYDPVEWSYMQA
ncbi:LINE-1 retrotransposable element ORF2 protein [Linum perenne]